MNALTVSGLRKTKDGQVILNNVSFIIHGLQKVAIAGETGSGKTTLLKIMAGLVQRDEGSVLFDEQQVLGPEEQLLPGHPGIAYLSQHFELRNNYRVEEILEIANKMPEEEASVIFDVCRITHLLKRRTDQLSGGEKQRIATARPLITKPQLLLLDEPFSNLDLIHKTILKKVLTDISDKLKITCILTSHDPSDTLSWADEILVMKDGEIRQKGTPQQVYRQPRNEYVAGLFGRYNLFTAKDASLLSTIGSLHLNGTNAIARPESFKIIEDNQRAIKGKVTGVSFFGSYCEAEVSLNTTSIIIRTNSFNIKRGDNICLKLSLDDLWYL